MLKRDPVELRRGIGYVIQTVGLMPAPDRRAEHRDGPAICWAGSRRASRERVDELADAARAGSASCWLATRRELSGGQRQRVGVAQGARRRPAGDADGRAVRRRRPDRPRPGCRIEFLDIQRRLRKTIVFVTHDIDDAIKMADRIAILNVGGIVEQYAPPEGGPPRPRQRVRRRTSSARSEG